MPKSGISLEKRMANRSQNDWLKKTFGQKTAKGTAKKDEAVPLDESIVHARKDFQVRRAMLAYYAYTNSMRSETVQLLKRAGAFAGWDEQPIVVQEAWIAAANTAAEFSEVE